MAVIAFIAGILFWFSYRKLDAEEEKLNFMAVGVLNLPPTGGSGAPGS